MDLKDFVRKTLEDVAGAVDFTFKSGKSERIFRIAEEGIQFDLAVTTSNGDRLENDTSSGGNIKVLQAQINSKEVELTKNKTVSRVKFTIDMGYVSSGPKCA